MILADENIDHRFIAAIRKIDIDVYSIYELNRGLIDESILEFSRNAPRIILTEDKDFGEWVFAHRVEGISVLFWRYHYSETELMKQSLIKLLSERMDALKGHLPL